MAGEKIPAGWVNETDYDEDLIEKSAGNKNLPNDLHFQPVLEKMQNLLMKKFFIRVM